MASLKFASAVALKRVSTPYQGSTDLGQYMKFFCRGALRQMMAKELTFFSLFSIAELPKRCEPTIVDCRVEALCDTNAACTADPGDENYYACVCKEGFIGNGTVCRGKIT